MQELALLCGLARIHANESGFNLTLHLCSGAGSASARRSALRRRPANEDSRALSRSVAGTNSRNPSVTRNVFPAISFSR